MELGNKKYKSFAGYAKTTILPQTIQHRYIAWFKDLTLGDTSNQFKNVFYFFWNSILENVSFNTITTISALFDDLAILLNFQKRLFEKELSRRRI